MSILEKISQINSDSGLKNPVHHFLNGGCYVFAKKLQNKVGGELWYLTLEHHFVVKVNNKLYDSSGNVTRAYSLSKMISEKEFMSRPKLTKYIKGPLAQR